MKRLPQPPPTTQQLIINRQSERREASQRKAIISNERGKPGFGGLASQNAVLRPRNVIRKRPSRLVSAEREAEQRVNRLLSAMPAPTSSRKSARTSGESGGIILGLDKQNAGKDKATAGGLALGSDIKDTDDKANSSSATAIGGGFSFSSSSSANLGARRRASSLISPFGLSCPSSSSCYFEWGTPSFVAQKNLSETMTLRIALIPGQHRHVTAAC